MKVREASLSHETLTELLDYNPETGVFTWKKVTSNRVNVGDVAGQKIKGHLLIQINGWRYMAHRLAWFYVHKAWPKDEIDHENLIRDDNRLSNLREATHQQNVYNVKKRRHNTTGFKGVTFHKAAGRFMAQIRADRKYIYLGLFDTPEEAHAAYAAASKEHHGEYGVTL